MEDTFSHEDRYSLMESGSFVGFTKADLADCSTSGNDVNMLHMNSPSLTNCTLTVRGEINGLISSTPVQIESLTYPKYCLINSTNTSVMQCQCERGSWDPACLPDFNSYGCEICFSNLVKDKQDLLLQVKKLRDQVDQLQYGVCKSQPPKITPGVDSSTQTIEDFVCVKSSSSQTYALPKVLPPSRPILVQKAGEAQVIQPPTEPRQSLSIDDHTESQPNKKARPIPTVLTSATWSKPDIDPTDDNRLYTTLIIGDSILQGVKVKGLIKGIEVKTLRGAYINDISQKLSTVDISNYQAMILQIGTNDCQATNDVDAIISNYDNLLNLIYNSSPETTVIISGICPRMDARTASMTVSQVNRRLWELADWYGLQFIDNESHFKLRNGQVNRDFLVGDGLHLSGKGTSALLASMHEIVPVIQRRRKIQLPETNRCFKCEEGNHMEADCWHKFSVRCNVCNQSGHKAKNCRNIDH